VERKGQEENSHYTSVQEYKNPLQSLQYGLSHEEKCWNLHPTLNPKNCKKDAKKKNHLAMDLGNLVERILDVNEKIVLTIVEKDVNLSILHHNEGKEMSKLFHIKISVKMTKVDALFNSRSHANLIVADLVSNLGLKVHDHTNPYALAWVNKDGKLKVTK
jgi:hypothetical protein